MSLNSLIDASDFSRLARPEITTMLPGMYPSSFLIRSSVGELSPPPRCPVRTNNGSPRIGQWVGITMSSIVIVNGSPSRRALTRALASRAYLGSVGFRPRSPDFRGPFEGDPELEMFPSPADGVRVDLRGFLSECLINLQLELVM